MKYFILLAALLPATTVAVSAQMNPTLYHMKDLPLNTQLNPAFQPRNGSLYVGFPGLTSLAPSLMLSGEGLTLGNGYLSPNYGAIVRGAGDFGAAAFGYEHNLINVGFMLKNVYFTFDSKFKVNVEGRIPKDLQQLMWYGNGHDETLGKPLNFEGMGVSALGYSEISLGVSAEVVKNVFAGAKLKYLQGLFYGNVELGEGSSFVTNSSTYGITMTLNPDIFLAGVPVTVPQGEILVDELTAPGMGSYKFDAGSRGVAFDLGGSWDLPWVKGLNVSASVLDVGFISWSGHKLAPANPGGSTISFDGFSMSGDGSDFASSLIDSVKQKTSVTAATGSERTWLSPTVYAGVSYEVLKYLNVGALVGYRFSQRESMPLVALSANTQGFTVNASVSYSYFNRSNNVGVGLLVGRKVVQWHLIADNLLAANYKTAQNVNFRTGVNFLFGSDKSKRRPLIGGDALEPGADAELADTAAASLWQPLEDQQGAPTAARDSAASPRYRQAQADTATRAKSAAGGSARKPAKQTLSKEELLRRAMAEEADEDKTAVKSGKKQPKSAKSSAVQKKNPSREALIERAIREEAEEEAAASPKAKSAKAKEKNK
ncbi:MAG: DUF5723 family protein [Prevotellaceae bacterium]|jgi:hypothetical protein|nr:DUF5723 family protein [Prevotellaceae bacterium]